MCHVSPNLYHSVIRLQTPPTRQFAATLAFVVLGMGASESSAQQIGSDERFRPPAQPASLDEFVRRFAPLHVAVAPVISRNMTRLDVLRLEYDVQSGVCYQAMAIGPQLVDVDLRVFAQGELIAQDVQFDDYPAAQFCAARSGFVDVAVDAFEGSGMLEVGLFAEPRSLDAASGDRDELANRIDHAIARSAPGWTPIGTQLRTRFEGPGIERLPVSLAHAGCFAMIGVAEAALDDIDLVLRDPQGTELALDVALDATPALVYCPPSAAELVLEVASAEGRGSVAIQILELPH